jgi:adenine-specific DNA methylase
LAHQKNQLKGHWTNSGSTEMDFFTRAGTGPTDGKPGQGLKWWSFADLKMPGNCLAVNMDVTELLNSDFCQVDCVYFDPPYGGSSSDYSQIYRFLEEYVYGLPLEELPHIQAHGRKFVGRKNYETHFREMLEAASRAATWLFSYNDNSWKDIDYITDIIREFRKDTVVIVLSDDYRYLYRSKQGRTNNSSEYLIVARG